MRRSLIVVIMVMAAVSMAAAQDVSKIELFGGYSMLALGGRDITDLLNNATAKLPPTFTSTPSKFFKNGIAVSAVYNINQNFGVEANAMYNAGNLMKAYGTANGVMTNSRMRVSDFSCFLGPRYALRKNEKVTPFAHVLLGVNRFRLKPSYVAGGADQFYQLGLPYMHDNGFAVMAGGGLDIKVNKTISVRLIQADFILANNQIATSPKTDLGLKNVKLSYGVVFHLGGSK
jgi:opacity protein-like surface antigen